MKSIIHKLDKQTQGVSSIQKTNNRTSQSPVSDIPVVEEIPNGVDIVEELIADDGHYLTQSGEVPLLKKVFGRRVILGSGHNSTEWKDISEDEANEIIEKQKKLKDKLFEQYSLIIQREAE